MRFGKQIKKHQSSRTKKIIKRNDRVTHARFLSARTHSGHALTHPIEGKTISLDRRIKQNKKRRRWPMRIISFPTGYGH